MRVSSFGVDVDVDLTAEPLLEEHLWWVLPPDADTSDETAANPAPLSVRVERSGAEWRLVERWTHPDEVGEAVTASHTVDDLASLVERSIRSEIALRAPRHIFFHAGVVELDGEAVVIPGRSFVGKTTLVRALVEAGCGYVSDEYAVVDEKGWVQPYPRPLSLRQPGGGRRHVRAAELSVQTALAPLLPRAVLTLPHQPGAAPSLEPRFSRGAVMALMNNAVAARSRPAAAMAAAASIARRASYWRGVRGEAAVAAGMVICRLQGKL